MIGLGFLKIVCTTIAVVALLAFVLEANYGKQQKDLTYWQNQIISIPTEPYLITFLIAIVAFAVLLLIFVHHRELKDYIQKRLTRSHRKRKIAKFIVQRLLLQIELAERSMPKLEDLRQLDDPNFMVRLQLAREAAFSAINLFRRDANALLFRQCRYSSDNSFYVMQEDEMKMLNDGYSDLGLHVINKTLHRLLFPAISIVN